MPSFTTPGPAALHIQFTSGRLHVQLEDRDTAEIDVAPNNPSNAADVEHAPRQLSSSVVTRSSSLPRRRNDGSVDAQSSTSG